MLNEILAQVGAVTKQVTDIADTAAAQSTNLEQVNVAVGAIDRMTQQNAAMVEQSTAATRSLSSEAQRLGELVSQFRVSNAGQPAAVAAPAATTRSKMPAHQSPSPAPVRKTAAAATKLARPSRSPSPAPQPVFEGNLARQSAPVPVPEDDDWSEF